MELTFGDGAVAEKAGRDDVVATHAVGERQADRKRQSAADDGVAAVEVGCPIEQVHGAAPPAAATLLLAVHFGKSRRHRHPADQCLPVLPVSCHHAIALL